MFDELASGIGSAAAPDIEAGFAISHAIATAILFLAPGALALVVEPYLFVLADRHPRTWFVRLGTLAMAVGALGAAIAPGPWTFALALGVLYIAIGVASGVGRAALIDREPAASARTLARFTLLSLGGDLAAPALLAGCAALGASWRTAYVVVAALLLIWALLLFVGPVPERTAPTDDASAADADAPSPGVIATLCAALADRPLLVWLFAMALCELLDEIFVVLAAIHVRIDLAGSAFTVSALIAAFVAGGALGLAAIDRILRTRVDRAVLPICAAACAITYVAWLAAPSPLVAILLAAPVGALAAPLYPLVAARAYAQRPDATATVMAASHLFTPLSLAFPFLLGVAADHLGTLAALSLLAVQPLGIAVLAYVTRRRSGRQRGFG